MIVHDDQDFNFPLETIAPFVQNFANKTGVPVGGRHAASSEIFEMLPRAQQYPFLCRIDIVETMQQAECWITTWWFQIFFIFIPTWGNDPIWLIFFRWVETTN